MGNGWFSQAGERCLALICVTVVLVAFVVTNPMMPFRQYRTGSPGAATNAGICPGLPNTPGGEDPWGGCWPSSETTGVAGCPALTPQTGDVNIGTSNTLIENRQITGRLTFSTGVTNVVIRCVRVIDTGFFPIDLERNAPYTASDILLDRVEVDCALSANNSAAFLAFGVTIRDSKAERCLDAFRWSSDTIIEDSYCGSLGSTAGNDPHLDCAQTGGADGVIIRHNTFDGADTSDVAIWSDEGPVNDVLVEKNLLIGNPGYLLYVGKEVQVDPITNIVVDNNRFGRNGGFGPCTVQNATPTWTNNEFIDGVPLPISLC